MPRSVWPTLMATLICPLSASLAASLSASLPAYAAPPANDDKGATVPLAELRRCANLTSTEAKLHCYHTLSMTETERQKEGPDMEARHAAKKLHAEIVYHQEPSYITASSGLRLGSDANSSNLLYEAQLVKNVPITEIDPARRWWLDAPVRINVRQLNTESKPVRTPSFNPGVRFTSVSDDSLRYYTVGLHHYSNGQEGDGTIDGRANLINGSFNTNYLELTANRFLKKEGNWFSVGLRQHFYGTFEAVQRDQYPRRQLLLGWHSKHFNPFGQQWQVRLTETIGLGYRYRVKDEDNPENNIKARAANRFNTRIELIGKPVLAAPLRLYLRYDYGFDYYNIHFQQRINRFQIGVAALGGNE